MADLVNEGQRRIYYNNIRKASNHLSAGCVLEGMSDLCMYQFEDIVWDDFGRSEDHISYPGCQRPNAYFNLCDSRKKRLHEVTIICDSAGDRSAVKVDHRRGQTVASSLSKRRNMMLEKDSSSHLQTGVPSSADSNSVKGAATLASDNTGLAYDLKSNNTGKDDSEFCSREGMVGDKATAVDDSSFSYTLGDVAQPGSNPEFFDSSENKDSSDFLYYGWPEIGDFEDVDRMFRSCDSTFGFGSSKEDELGWFPSADAVGGSREVVKSGFEFPAPECNTVGHSLGNHEYSRSRSMNCSPPTGTAVSNKVSSWTSEKSDSNMSFLNGPDMEDSEEGLLPKQEIEEYGKEFKQRKQFTGKRKDQVLENDCFSNMSSVAEEVMQLPFEATSCQAFPSFQKQQQEEASALVPWGAPLYAQSENSCFSDLTELDPTQHAVKSEASYLISPSPRDSSLVSNQLRTVDSLHDPSFQVPGPAKGGKREKLHSFQGSHSSTNSSLRGAGEAAKVSKGDPGLTGKHMCYSGNKYENHSDVEGDNLGTLAEIGTSSSIQESLATSLGVDDISLEAAGFHKLQLVMEQLDPRTKLCIRDSLYRLARSAEQRHKHSKSNSHLDSARDTSLSFLPEGTNSFMDIETETNPIDRSVAQLLFHRPSESCPVPANNDSLPLDSPSMIHGSVRPFSVDDLVSSGETASESGMISEHSCFLSDM